MISGQTAPATQSMVSPKISFTYPLGGLLLSDST